MFIFSPYAYSTFMAMGLLCTMSVFVKIFIDCMLSGSSIIVILSIFLYFQNRLDVAILLSPISCIFSAVVAFIASVVFCFISIYFHSWNNIVYFCWYTLSFVICILTLINFNDFFFVILGWDGLGISSYFLILYSQSSSSIYSASFTLLINRLGDCFLVIFIILWWGCSMNTHFLLENSSDSLLLSFLLFIALSTKSALFPFSPWLPAAMAAPTPISSLVHSSTLVTAGLFLIIQNTTILSYSPLCYFILVTSLFTSLYAGISALIESDLKKIVALSTLRHLGFIGMAISLNFPYLAFFHLLTHAFFKSSLFISVGVFIISSGHYQDSRIITSIHTYNPYFTSIVLVREANLLGLPFIAGFYSKDLILEISQYSSIGVILEFILYLNVFLTFCYTLRILLALSNKNNTNPLILSSNSLLITNYLFFIYLFLLSFLRIVFGLLFSKLIVHLEISVPRFTKIFPITLLFITITLFIINQTVFSYHKGNYIGYFVSSIILLSPVWANTSSNLFLKLSQKVLFIEESSIKSTLILFITITLKTLSNFLSFIFVTAIPNRRKLFYILLIFFLFFTYFS